MFQFLLAELHMHRGMGFSLVPFVLIQSIKERMEFLRRISLRDFWTWYHILVVVNGLHSLSVVIACLHCLPVCNERI